MPDPEPKIVLLAGASGVVGKNALDILLDYLPWNIHLVKLPWLKDSLYVDWR